MKHAKHIEDQLKEPENSFEYWLEQVEEHGPEHVERLRAQASVSEVWTISARQAIDEYKKNQRKQEIESSKRRDEREEETLELAKEANRIARRSRKEMRYTWAATVIIGVLTIINMILLARG